MGNSHLGRLPAELRNRIWELALYQHEGLILDRFSKRLRRLHRSTRDPLALLRTCRATYIECRAMFYAINTFHLHSARKCTIVEDTDRFSKQLGQPVFFGGIVLEMYRPEVYRHLDASSCRDRASELQGTLRAVQGIRGRCAVVQLGFRRSIESRDGIEMLDITRIQDEESLCIALLRLHDPLEAQ